MQRKRPDLPKRVRTRPRYWYHDYNESGWPCKIKRIQNYELWVVLWWATCCRNSGWKSYWLQVQLESRSCYQDLHEYCYVSGKRPKGGFQMSEGGQKERRFLCLNGARKLPKSWQPCFQRSILNEWLWNLYKRHSEIFWLQFHPSISPWFGPYFLW